MDSKDLIIVAGSIFFLLIVAHGLWVARRQKLNEIRMDIDVTESASDHVVDEVSPDFPNGGARVISEALASAEPDRARLRESAGDLGDAEASASLPLRSDSPLSAKGAKAPVVDQPATVSYTHLTLPTILLV